MIYISRLTDGITTGYLVVDDSSYRGVHNERVENELTFVTRSGKPSRATDPCTYVTKDGKLSVAPFYPSEDPGVFIRPSQRYTWTVTKLDKHARMCGLYVYKVEKQGTDWYAVGRPGRAGAVVTEEAPFKLHFPLAKLHAHHTEGWVITGPIDPTQGTATVYNFMEVK